MVIIINILKFKSVYMQRIESKNVVDLTFRSTSIFYRSYTKFYVISFLLWLLYVCIYRDYIYGGEKEQCDIAFFLSLEVM